MMYGDGVGRGDRREEARGEGLLGEWLLARLERGVRMPREGEGEGEGEGEWARGEAERLVLI